MSRKPFPLIAWLLIDIFPGSPSMRDIVFHSQWCAAVAMVAVEWPGFACQFHSCCFMTLHANVSFSQTPFSRRLRGLHSLTVRIFRLGDLFLY